MSEFICNGNNGEIGRWAKSSQSEDRQRCAQLRIEASKASDSIGPSRKSGERALLEGDWTKSTYKILETINSAPEVSQEVIHKPFPDRYAHTSIQKNWSQRADFIFSSIESLDYDDQMSFQQRLIRDMIETIRALSGDVFDLQSRLGEAMIRIDHLENWVKTGDENVHNLPGSTSKDHNTSEPKVPYFTSDFLVSTRDEAYKYHQGYHVHGQDAGLRRYFSAQEAAGIEAPEISPIAEWRNGYRYDQSELAPDGYRRCKRDEKRCGNKCVGSGDTCSEASHPIPTTKAIPVITNWLYKPQHFNTGQFFLGGGMDGVVELASGFKTGPLGEVYHDVPNIFTTPPPKCLPPLYQPNVFVAPPFVPGYPDSFCSETGI